MSTEKFEDLIRANPDQFDEMDCRPGRSRYPRGSRERVVPEHIRKEIEERRRRERDAGGK
jgi:hypothetical protein